jgi:hypothetical protein
MAVKRRNGKTVGLKLSHNLALHYYMLRCQSRKDFRGSLAHLEADYLKPL